MISLRKRVTRWGLIFFAIVLVLLATLVTIVRNYEGDYHYIRTLVEVQFEKDLQQEAYIRHFSIDWKYLLPRFYLQDVQIGEPRQPESALHVNEAWIDVNWVKTFTKRRLNLDKVTLSGIEVEVRRNLANEIKINQTLLLPLLAGRSANYKVSSLFAIEVSGLSIHWLDEPLDLDYFFPSITLNVYPSSGTSKLSAAVELPAEIGEQLTVVASMNGKTREWRENDIEVYIRADELKLHELAAHFRSSAVSLPVSFSFESWGKIQDGKLSFLTGQLSAIDLQEHSEQISYPACQSNDFIRAVDGGFQWKRHPGGWNLQLGDLNVRSQQNEWPRGEVGIVRQTVDQQVRTLVHADYFESGSVCNTLAQFPLVRNWMDQEVQSFGARLEVWDGSAFIAEQDLRIQYYGADIGNFRLAVTDRETGQALEGLAGNLLLGDKGGILRLDERGEIQVHEPALYQSRTIDARLDGTLQWQAEEFGWRLWSDRIQLKNDDIDLLNRFSVQWNADDLYVDMQSVLQRAAVPMVAKYFPDHERVAKTRQWLAQSLVAGEIESAVAVIRGRLDQFPFNTESGVFMVAGSVNDGKLNYRPGWPNVEQVKASVTINKDQITANSTQATVVNAKLEDVQVRIASFLRPIAEIRGTANGQASSLLQFLRQSRLVKEDNPILENMNVQGSTALRLEIDKSLSRKVKNIDRVAGQLELKGAEVDIPAAGIELKDLRGKVQFNRDGLIGNQLSASLFGQQVALSVAPTVNGASALKLSVPFDTTQYLSQQFPQLTRVVTGTTLVQVNVGIPPIFNLSASNTLSYQVQSDLQGVQVDLPQPFGKSIEQVQHFELFNRPEQKTVQIRLPKLAEIALKKDNNGKYSLQGIHLGSVTSSNSISQKAFIRGTLSSFDAQEWWRYWQSYKNSQNSAVAKKTWPAIHVFLDRVTWGSMELTNLELQGSQSQTAYTLGLNSPATAGTVVVPLSANNIDTPIKLEFKRLKVPLVKTATENEQSDLPLPTEIPLISANIKNMQVGEFAFDQVLVDSQRIPQGIDFERIVVNGKDLQIKASGQWRYLSSEGVKTDFIADITSSDVEDSLQSLGYTSVVGGGDAKIKIDMRWPGSPLDYSLATAWADIDLSVWDGAIKNVDPGAGRLLALVNLGAIGRRLSFDFDDVTDEGFAFDSVIGQLRLNNSDLHIKDLTLLSPTADIVINGTTNVVDKTYDQDLSVTPKLSGGLPVAGALLGGPIVGAAIIVVDQLSKSVGSNIDKVSTVKYKLTGTWEHPHFEKLTKSEPKNKPTSQYNPVKP